MNCKQIREEIDAASRHNMRSGAVRSHMDACPDCRRYSDETASLTRLLGAQPRVEARRISNSGCALGCCGRRPRPQSLHGASCGKSCRGRFPGDRLSPPRRLSLWSLQSPSSMSIAIPERRSRAALSSPAVLLIRRRTGRDRRWKPNRRRSSPSRRLRPSLQAET